jgi:hypothetical protein
MDACQILLKLEKLLSMRIAELTTFQRSKVLDVGDDTYPIISRYRDFILERHETYRYSSEQCFVWWPGNFEKEGECFDFIFLGGFASRR